MAPNVSQIFERKEMLVSITIQRAWLFLTLKKKSKATTLTFSVRWWVAKRTKSSKKCLATLKALTKKTRDWGTKINNSKTCWVPRPFQPSIQTLKRSAKIWRPNSMLRSNHFVKPGRTTKTLTLPTSLLNLKISFARSVTSGRKRNQISKWNNYN